MVTMMKWPAYVFNQTDTDEAFEKLMQQTNKQTTTTATRETERERERERESESESESELVFYAQSERERERERESRLFVSKAGLPVLKIENQWSIGRTTLKKLRAAKLEVQWNWQNRQAGYVTCGQ